jgi:hypothetical protein
VRGVGVVHRRPDGSGVGAAKARAAARSKRAPALAAGLSAALSAALGRGACRKLSKKKDAQSKRIVNGGLAVGPLARGRCGTLF